ncbi:MAG: type 4a pilus biogenesis protein PilO [Planctomycetes bacterium]|nr:type 4a pilus biogenesis protein PilO [Planctomycetota bacterium]
MKVNLSGKTTLWISSAVAAAGVVAYVALFFFPRRAEIAELRRQTEEKDRYALQAVGAAAAVAGATAELNEAARFIRDWRNEAPSEGSVIGVFRGINQAAQTAQTKNLRIEPAPAEKLAAVWRMPVKIAVEGSFPELFGFVRELEPLSSAVWISDVEIAAERDRKDLRMNLTLTIFGPGPEFSGQAGLAD